MSLFKFKLGSKLKDLVTGFEGICTARLQYLNGCRQYCISPKGKKSNTHPEGFYNDEQQLKCIGKGIKVELAEAIPGGGSPPQESCPPTGLAHEK